MTLNVNQPTDQALVSELPGYIREDRAAINAVSGSGDVGATNKSIGAGVTSLTVGTDLGLFGYEAVKITGTGASTLETILGGTNGQTKVLMFSDANIKLKDGLAADGKFYLNQLPALSDYEPVAGSVIALVNIGGTGVAPGYWKELYRSDPLK